MTPEDEAVDPRPAKVTPIGVAPPKSRMKWIPVRKAEATGVATRSKLDQSAQDRLIEDAAEILGLGVDPASCQGSATGLVVGYVQSGKTLSFTTVIGLARDNGFPLVIVIAGTKDSLLNQSHDRLLKDLNVDAGDGLPAWKMRKNVRATDPNDEQFIRQGIEAWRNDDLEEDERATVILTVLKQRQRLQSLTTLLTKLNLHDVPVLVIDDEADQASLNTKVRQGEESATYSNISDLRNALPCHTYLQYTATPQAPLLINIADVLSPNFHKVLEPGAGYVGGKDFFAPASRYIRDIPPNDLAPGADPPQSMLEAVQVFFVGLATSLTQKPKLRSMLIHPSRLRADHRQVVEWVGAAKTNWESTLKLPQTDPDRVDLVAEFQAAYDHLLTTTPDLPPLEEVLAKLPRALRNTTIIEFNTNGRPKTPEINWRHAEGWILVGGQAVDRGFTVNSLTVTYMPRGVGMGNADALQQRARFFGYKREYLGLCRVWVEGNTRAAFEDYVEHEEIMRAELMRLEAEGKSLKTWRRRFVLSADLQPCRKNVVADDFTRPRRLGGWTQQKGALMTPELRQDNSAALERLIDELSMETDTTTYPTNEVAQQHFVAREVPLQRVVDTLVEYRLEDPRDTAAFTGILITLGEALRQFPDTKVAIYQMRPNAKTSFRRTVSDEGTLEDGFQQGRTALSGGGTAYPGDAAFQMPDRPTIQLHRYDLIETDDGPPSAKAAPLLAIHIPAALARAWLVQIQAGQAAS